MEPPILAIIIPCYNEEECLESTVNRLLEVSSDLKSNNVISEKSFIFCVDDGSRDKTKELIKKLNQENGELVRGISFSRNFGNQKAIAAGLIEVSKYDPDCCITVDADLQQDENKIGEFVEKYKNGAEIVLGIRNDRKTDDIFKKSTALSFYKLMKFFGVELEINHSEYRLVGKKVVNALTRYKESNLFLRGIVQSLGFKKDYVYFDVKPREKGKSKFNTFSLFTLAINGITSFSIVPLRMLTLLGFLMSFTSFIIGIYAIIDRYTGSAFVPGWATIIVLVGFVSGIQILCLGIIAEYIGQIFQEVKSRPRYIIEEEID